MSPLLTYLQAHAQAPLGHVYIVGAGDGSQLPQWRSLNAQQLWLAEAHPALSTRLLARTQAHENESVTQAAITGQAEAHATLHLLSLPGKSSLSAPTHLNHYFPNVQEQGSQQVAAQALSAWATHAGEDTHHEHLLVIDSPGQAHQLISDTPASALQQFAWVHITAAEEALYEQDAPLSEIDALLQQRGYACCEEDADTHYPFIARLYQRQPSVVERLALEATINALRKEITQAQTDTEEANKATATAKSEAEKLANELEQARANAKQREEARATAKSETEKLAKELEEAH
ncbi:MAG: hypothetical protein M1154_08245, partial [Gammaproteobacteria bacterium]|nr:hypothetical protein [Gammaproteobacteria bacterium]